MKYSRYRKILLALCLSALGGSAATSAYANGSGSGLVVGLNAEGPSGKFSTSGGHPNAPPCSTGRWAVDISTTQGQAMWATIMTAYAQKLAIAVGGTGACSVWPDSETVAWVQLP